MQIYTSNALLWTGMPIEEWHDTRFLGRSSFHGAILGGIGCSSTLLIIFISPIMVGQKSNKQNKILN